MIRFQRVAARLKTSLRGEIVPPANTSGAMNRGVPIPTVPPASFSSSSRATPKSTSMTPLLAVDQVLRLHVAVDDLLLVHVLERLAGVWRAYSITSLSGSPGVPRSSQDRAEVLPFTSSITM